MPRKPRHILPNHVYQVLNRASDRATLFHTPDDYAAFERVLTQTHERYPLRILAYVLMPNHFHLVLWPARGAVRTPDPSDSLRILHPFGIVSGVRGAVKLLKLFLSAP